MRVCCVSPGRDNAPRAADAPGQCRRSTRPDDRRAARALSRTSRAACPAERSIANSAGLLGWPSARGDWVRPGLDALRRVAVPERMPQRSRLAAGHDAAERSDRGARPCRRASGRLWRGLACRARPRIAVAAVGYGDGYPRSTASGAPVLINGHRAPIVGRVSMDMIAIDVTELPADRRRRSGHAVGRRRAGRGRRALRRHDTLRVALRRESARSARSALNARLRSVRRAVRLSSRRIPS